MTIIDIVLFYKGKSPDIVTGPAPLSLYRNKALIFFRKGGQKRANVTILGVTITDIHCTGVADEF